MICCQILLNLGGDSSLSRSSLYVIFCSPHCLGPFKRPRLADIRIRTRPLIMSSGLVFLITEIEGQLNNRNPLFDQAGFDRHNDLQRGAAKYPQPNSNCETMDSPTKQRESPPWRRALQCQDDYGGKGWPITAGRSHAQGVNDPPSEENPSQEKHFFAQWHAITRLCSLVLFQCVWSLIIHVESQSRRDRSHDKFGRTVTQFTPSSSSPPRSVLRGPQALSGHSPHRLSSTHCPPQTIPLQRVDSL